MRLVDVRHTGGCYPVATGRKRSGKRVLSVGTDCALGKKYTALALSRALRARGAPATFRATGQTGIMIAGAGIPMDAVVSDFLAGAAEQLTPDNTPDHWDVVEGTRLTAASRLCVRDPRAPAWLSARRDRALSRPGAAHD